MSESRLVIDNQEYQTYLSELGKGLGLVSSRVPGLGLVSSRCPGSWVGYIQYNLQYLPGPKRWELRYSKHQGGTVTKHKQNILIFVSPSCSYFSLSRSISSFSLDSSSISSYPAFSYFCSRFPSWLSAVPFMHTQKHCKTNSYEMVPKFSFWRVKRYNVEIGILFMRIRIWKFNSYTYSHYKN